jgi:hypothetical protein
VNDRKVNRMDVMWVIEFLDQLVEEGKLDAASGEALQQSLLARPME